MVFKSKGILNFNSVAKTKKQQKQGSWKKYALISVSSDIEGYYRWFLLKRFNLKLNKTLRGTHITVVNDIVNDDLWTEIVKKYQGKEIEFFYEIEPFSNGDHWWLRIHSPLAEEIRKQLGLKPDPFFGFHITLGYCVDLHLEYSKYILRQCKRFGLITHTLKESLSTHHILN